MKSLKIILPVGLGLFLIVGIATHNIRRDAEKSLNKEEMITAARNRQILSQKEALENSEKQRQQAREDREFKRFLGLKD